MILCAKIINCCQFSATRTQIFFSKIPNNTIEISSFSRFFKKSCKNIWFIK